MRPDDITPEEWVLRVLDAPDDDVGPACMNVPCPPTIASDDDFREAYCQGYRHALADVRSAIVLRDERVRAAERERIATWIEQESQAPVYKADDIDVVIRSLGRVIRREGGDTNAQ